MWSEQLYQRSSHTVAKVLGSTTNFPTLGSSKGTAYPQGIWLWRSAGFDYRTSTELGKQTLGGHKQNLVFIRTQEKGAMTSQETEQDLAVCAWESLSEAWVDSDRRGVGEGQEPWLQQSWEAQLARMSPFEWGCSCCHYPYHSLASGQTTGREHSSTHQQKTGLDDHYIY